MTINEQNIERKDFRFPIIISVMSIILSFVNDFLDNDNSMTSWSITVLLLYSIIHMWFYFRDYLKNFNATKSIKLINWAIVMKITLGLLLLVITLLSNASNEWYDTDILRLLLMIFFVVITIISLVIYIKLGITFLKINNDFIGLLKELGLTITYLFPIVLLLIILGTLTDNKMVSILATIIDNVSTVIMIMIFIRAQKFVKAI